jgi:hypothetical protein
MTNIIPIAYLWTIPFSDGTFGYKLARTKEELELGMEPDEVRDIEPLMMVLTHESIIKGYKKKLANSELDKSLEAWKYCHWGA